MKDKDFPKNVYISYKNFFNLWKILFDIQIKQFFIKGLFILKISNTHVSNNIKNTSYMNWYILTFDIFLTTIFSFLSLYKRI